MAETIASVIPLYNKGDMIVRAVRSVVAQTRLPDALIVVDDGSTDGSADLARAALGEVPDKVDCRFLSQANAGVSVARNAGANAVDSDIIAFLDADDQWLPGQLAEIERLAQHVPDAGLLSTRKARRDDDGNFVPDFSALPPGHFGAVDNGLAAYREGYGILHTSAIAVRRGAWERSGGFPPGARKSQDMHLWLRLLLRETFAHSDICTTQFHEEASGVKHRHGVVPAHFSYFLDSPDGRAQLDNSDLSAFLSGNLINSVAGHRLSGDDAVVAELLRMSNRLDLRTRILARAVSKAPRAMLAAKATQRRRQRQAAAS
ncbi:MAG: glycosyltransferase family 2 protein [Pontixanthobacter sp.]